jgi:hypothetical protein
LQIVKDCMLNNYTGLDPSLKVSYSKNFHISILVEEEIVEIKGSIEGNNDMSHHNAQNRFRIYDMNIENPFFISIPAFAALTSLNKETSLISAVYSCLEGNKVCSLSEITTPYDVIGVSGQVIQEIKTVNLGSDVKENDVKITCLSLLMNEFLEGKKKLAVVRIIHNQNLSDNWSVKNLVQTQSVDDIGSIYATASPKRVSFADSEIRSISVGSSSGGGNRNSNNNSSKHKEKEKDKDRRDIRRPWIAAIEAICNHSVSCYGILTSIKASFFDHKQLNSGGGTDNSAEKDDGIKFLAKYRRIYKVVCREARVLLDPPSSEVSTNSMQIAHPASIPPALAMQDTAIKILSLLRTLLRGEGQAIILRDEFRNPSFYEVIYTGNGISWPGLTQGCLGKVPLSDYNSLVESVMISRKTVTLTDCLSDQTYNRHIDGCCEGRNIPMIVIPLRGSGGSTIGVMICVRGQHGSHYTIEDVTAAEVISTISAISLYWCKGVETAHSKREISKPKN